MSAFGSKIRLPSGSICLWGAQRPHTPCQRKTEDAEPNQSPENPEASVSKARGHNTKPKMVVPDPWIVPKP